jgi:hypothetical protein
MPVKPNLAALGGSKEEKELAKSSEDIVIKCSILKKLRLPDLFS